MPRPHRFAALVLAMLTIAGTTACGDDPATVVTQQGRVRAIHAIGNALPVDILVDGVVVTPAAPLAYGARTSYVSVAAGARQFAFRLAGSTTNVVEFGLTVFANQDQTILAAGRLGTTGQQERLVPIRDDAAPAAGQASLRFVHASPPIANVDVYVTAPDADLAAATPQRADVVFGAVQAPLALAPGTYRIRVTPTGTKTVAIDRGNLVLAADGRYIAIAVGDDAPVQGAASPFTVLFFAENAN